MSHTNTFKHVTLHAIDISTQRVIFWEPFKETAWLMPDAIITRGGMSYQVKRQQHGVDHYYIWVEPREDI